MFKQSGNIKTAICSAPNPGTIVNNNNGSGSGSAGTSGDKCVMLISITDGSWVNLKGVDFGTAGATKFVVSAASASTGGSIEIRTGSQTGTLAGTCNIGATGGITTWKDIECDVSALTGVKDYLYLVFKGTGTDQFRVSKYIFKTSDIPSNISVTCNLNNLNPSYVAGSNIPRPNIVCGNETTAGTASFYVSGASDTNAIAGWNSSGSTNAFYNPGTRTITLGKVTCGTTEVPLNPRISCGSFEIIAASSSSSNNGSSSSSEDGETPILNSKFSILNSQINYYSIKGEPLGNAKPQKAGIYIVKQGNSVRKIAVK